MVCFSAFCGLDIDAHSGQHPYQDTYKIKKNSSNKKKIKTTWKIIRETPQT